MRQKESRWRRRHTEYDAGADETEPAVGSMHRTRTRARRVFARAKPQIWLLVFSAFLVHSWSQSL